ncbi:hypothetical protein [Cellulomonas soli]
MNAETAADPPHVAPLARLLQDAPAEAGELPLLTALEEIEDWRRHAGTQGWLRHSTRLDLCAELQNSLIGIGHRLSTHLERDLNPYLRAATEEFSRRRATPESVASMNAAPVRAALLSRDGLLASWRDLVASVAAGDDEVAHWSHRCLHTQLESRGLGALQVLRDASSTLRGHRLWDVPPASDLPFTEREALAEAGVAIDPSTPSCIAWLTFDNARLDTDFTLELGPITFVDADWALPNAIREDGHPFPFRDELRALALEGNDWGFDGDNWTHDRSQRPYIVLARVDLGERPLASALSDAERAVQLLLDIVQIRGGGIPWRATGHALLLADGNPTSVRYGLARLGEHRNDQDHYGSNAFAAALHEYGPQLSGFFARTLPPELTEAVRILGEAALTEDERSGELRRTIDARTALALYDAALDHLATFAGLDRKELEERVLAEWPHTTWRIQVARAIDTCLSASTRADSGLREAVKHNRTYEFVAASERAEELLACIGDPLRRRCAARWLHSIDSAAAYLALESELSATRDLLAKRARRARNGVMHGNPPPAAVTASVMDFSRYRVLSAFWYAMEAVAASQPMADVLQQWVDSRRLRDARLAAGESLFAQWNSARIG